MVFGISIQRMAIIDFRVGVNNLLEVGWISWKDKGMAMILFFIEEEYNICRAFFVEKVLETFIDWKLRPDDKSMQRLLLVQLSLW